MLGDFVGKGAQESAELIILLSLNIVRSCLDHFSFDPCIVCCIVAVSKTYMAKC